MEQLTREVERRTQAETREIWAVCLGAVFVASLIAATGLVTAYRFHWLGGDDSRVEFSVTGMCPLNHSPQWDGAQWACRVDSDFARPGKWIRDFTQPGAYYLDGTSGETERGAVMYLDNSHVRVDYRTVRSP